MDGSKREKVSTRSALQSQPVLSFPFFSFRNISCPEDSENGRKVFAGRAPAEAILDLPTDENVREYLVDAEGKKRHRPSDVHRAIQDTILNYPDKFCVLNGGVVIVARGCEADDSKKVLKLLGPSIINGAQTQGVLRDAFEELRACGEDSPVFHVTFELIVTDDEGLIAETSIARNYQNDVKAVSIAGRLGQLDELEAALQSKLPGVKLRKSETQLSDDYVSSENLLQVITALIPESLWLKASDGGSPNKVFTYSQRAKCLKDFQETFTKAKNPKDPEHARHKALYQFYLDIAADAYQLHSKWKTHQGFSGTGLRSIEREGRTIVEVPDGIVFPILASLSAFAVKTPQGWAIKPPHQFRDEELIGAAKAAYVEMAEHNPQTMGKTRACYSSLYQITSIYKKLLA
jgi:AIPR protein